jgi:hypothetical protein
MKALAAPKISEATVLRSPSRRTRSGDAIAQLGIDPGQPGLNYPGRIVLAQGTHHLIGEAQAFFYISTGFRPVNPSIKRANIVLT